MAADPATNAAERAVSAFVGYTMGAVVVLPFDRLKTMMQVAQLEGGKTVGSIPLARAVLRRQGLMGLYQGGGAHMLIAPYTVLYYTIYGELMLYGAGSPWAPLWAACCARTLEVTARMPLEVARTQMQAASGAVSLTSCFRLLWAQPFSQKFRGYVPTLLRDVPFSAIYWASYEQAAVRMALPEQCGLSPGLRTFLQGYYCGAFAGMVAALTTTPTDVVKTVRQHSIQAGETRSYSDIIEFIKAQPQTAFSGVGPRLIRIPLGMATMMSGMEFTKWYFERRRTLRLQAAEGGGDPACTAGAADSPEATGGK